MGDHPNILDVTSDRPEKDRAVEDMMTKVSITTEDPPNCGDHQDSSLRTTPPVEKESMRKQRLSEANLDTPCSFNKRGKCLKHNVMGKKSTLKSRKWVRKRYGFGWVTKQSTVYTCIADKVDTTSQYYSKEVSCESPGLGELGESENTDLI